MVGMKIVVKSKTNKHYVFQIANAVFHINTKPMVEVEINFDPLATVARYGRITLYDEKTNLSRIYINLTADFEFNVFSKLKRIHLILTEVVNEFEEIGYIPRGKMLTNNIRGRVCEVHDDGSIKEVRKCPALLMTTP